MKDKDPAVEAWAVTKSLGYKIGETYKCFTGEFTLQHLCLLEATLAPFGLFQSKNTHILYALPLDVEDGQPMICGLTVEDNEVTRQWTDLLFYRFRPEAGAKYRHYKGSLYQVSALALCPSKYILQPAALEGRPKFQPVVVYYPVPGDYPVWVRPIDSFMETVMVQRFKKEE